MGFFFLVKNKKIKKSITHAVKCSGGGNTCLLLRSPSMSIAVKNRLGNPTLEFQQVCEKEDRENTRKHLLFMTVYFKYHPDPGEMYNSILRQFFESKHWICPGVLDQQGNKWCFCEVGVAENSAELLVACGVNKGDVNSACLLAVTRWCPEASNWFALSLIC